MFAHDLPATELFTPDAARLLVAARDLAAARDLSSVMVTVRRAARDLTGADGVTFVLRDGDLVHYADEDAIAPLWKGSRFPANACISGWAMTHRQTVVVPDISADARIPQELYRRTFVKSLAMVPVRRDDPIAAIGAYWARRHHATAAEVALLEALAGFAALALENDALVRGLRGAIQARDEFLSLASHELRTPLTSLRLLVSGALRPGVRDPERLRAVLSRADGLVSRLAGLVTQVLDASRGGPDPRALERVPTDLGELVARVVARADPSARARVSVRSEGAVRGRWDPDRLEQVVEHLVSNALKFGAERPVSIELARAGAAATLVVRDRGIGIAARDRDRIFDRFERAVSSRNFGGFGMGLWVVRRNVEAHGGTVDVESRLGDGAAFTVTLPLEPPQASAADAAAPLDG